MTRTQIDYNTNNSVIYRIRCNDSNCGFTYTGATTNFTSRKRHHKHLCNNLNSKQCYLLLYKTIRENGGWDNWTMNIIEIFPCESKQHLCVREQYHIEQQENKINMVRAFISEEQKLERDKDNSRIYYNSNRVEIIELTKKYNNANKEEKKEYDKKYNEANKDIRKEKRKKFLEANRTEVYERNRKYKEANRDEINKRQNAKNLAKREAKKQAVILGVNPPS